MENITLLGIDLAKRYSHIICQNHKGKTILKKKVATLDLVKEVKVLGDNFKIVMEACGGSNHWGRELEKNNYKVELLPPQYVASYRLRQKNDYNDARAACEASKREDIHPVPVKSLEKQMAQHFIRSRRRLIDDLVGLANHLHGMLSEYGFYSPKGHNKLVEYLKTEVLTSDTLNKEIKELIEYDLAELEERQKRINEVTNKIKVICKQNKELKRMMTVPGIGPITALSVYGAVEDLTRFKNGRQFAAFLGLVPRQYSTGGETILGHIPKNGKFPLRTLLVHGARSVISHAHKRNDQLNLWVTELEKRKHRNLATVALANKLARILWSVSTSQKEYTIDHKPTAFLK